MQIYAHRAGRGLAPENTLQACQIALGHGIDFIDFDLGMTKDGELVVTHDSCLNPDLTKNHKGDFITEPIPIYELTYQELLSYNVGQINPDSPYASYFPDQEQMEQAHIPLLREAIELVLSLVGTGAGFQLEIKTDPTEPHLTATPEAFAKALHAVLVEYSLFERTEVQAFDYRCLLSFQKNNPFVKTSYLTPAEADFSFSPLWTAGYDVKNYENSMPKMIKALGGSCWGPFQEDVTEEKVREAKDLGLKIVPWGYPEKEGTEFNHYQIVKLIEWGVDGVITDRPDVLKNLLNQR